MANLRRLDRALLVVLRTRFHGPEMLVLATLMSLTRPYLGLHYPSDVLGGALFGSAVGLTARGLAR